MEQLIRCESIKNTLHKTIDSLLIPGKGLLATDENPEVISSRLDAVSPGIGRHWYLFLRILYNTPYIENYVSAVLFCKNTALAVDDFGTFYKNIVINRELSLGIQFEIGQENLHGSNGESVVEGLDDMENRCKKLKQDGFRFSLWKCTVKIGKKTPSLHAIQENAKVAALYACECQKIGIVPIIHAEVLSEGDHNLIQSQKVTEVFFSAIFKSLIDYHVYLEGMLFRPSIVVPGINCKKTYSTEEIIEATAITFKRTIPVALPGITLMCGNFTEADAATYLNAICLHDDFKPWKLVFSLDNPLQERAMSAWSGLEENIKLTEDAFLHSLIVISYSSCGMHGSPDEAEDLKGEARKEQEEMLANLKKRMMLQDELGKQEEERKQLEEKKRLRREKYAKYGLILPSDYSSSDESDEEGNVGKPM